MKSGLIIFSLCTFGLGFSAAGGVIVNCNSPYSPSVPVVPGVPGSSCDIMNAYGSQASAGAAVSISSPISVTAQAETQFTTLTTAAAVNANATATYDADLTFTIFGSTGDASTLVTFSQNVGWDANSNAYATVSLGSYTNTLFQPGFESPEFLLPFTFGVPFTLHLFLEAFADSAGVELCCGSGYASATFGFGEVYIDGAPFGPAQYAIEEVTPEPSSVLMVTVGVGLALLRRRFGGVWRVGSVSL